MSGLDWTQLSPECTARAAAAWTMQCQVVRCTSDPGPWLLGSWVTITALLMFTLSTATGHDGAEITDKEPVNPFKSINQI